MRKNLQVCTCARTCRYVHVHAHTRERNNSYNAVNVLQWQRFDKNDMCRNVYVCACACLMRVQVLTCMREK